MLVEECRATAKMSHMKLAGDVFVLENVEPPSNLVFEGSRRLAFGTWVQRQDAQAGLFLSSVSGVLRSPEAFFSRHKRRSNFIAFDSRVLSAY